MSSSEHSKPRGPGRPRAFDEAVVVGQALDLFWQHGFHQTSMRDISKATGLTLTSLTNAFGNKVGLFRCAMDSYLDRLDRFILAPLHPPSAGVPAIREVFEQAVESSKTGQFSHGCMACNAILDLASLKDPDVAAQVDTAFGTIQSAFEHVLERAQAQGTVTRHVSAAELSHHLLLIFQGLSLQARSGKSQQELRGYVETGLALLTDREPAPV
jgi:TetR/AcrR family transcriptional repressor of nem operon